MRVFTFKDRHPRFYGEEPFGSFRQSKLTATRLCACVEMGRGLGGICSRQGTKNCSSSLMKPKSAFRAITIMNLRQDGLIFPSHEICPSRGHLFRKYDSKVEGVTRCKRITLTGASRVF